MNLLFSNVVWTIDLFLSESKPQDTPGLGHYQLIHLSSEFLLWISFLFLCFWASLSTHYLEANDSYSQLSVLHLLNSAKTNSSPAIGLEPWTSSQQPITSVILMFCFAFLLVKTMYRSASKSDKLATFLPRWNGNSLYSRDNWINIHLRDCSWSLRFGLIDFRQNRMIQNK